MGKIVVWIVWSLWIVELVIFTVLAGCVILWVSPTGLTAPVIVLGVVVAALVIFTGVSCWLGVRSLRRNEPVSMFAMLVLVPAVFGHLLLGVIVMLAN